MLGEEVTDISGEYVIHLPGVKNDYMSASYKQFLGLKYIVDHWTPDFIYCCGTDTYVNVPKLYQLLQLYNPDKALYIGGDGDVRDVANSSLYYHSGGAGFVLSRECLNRLYTYFSSAVEYWHTISPAYLHSACDVAIAYYCRLPSVCASTIILPRTQFMACNYNGYPCHIGKVDKTKLICCHYMSPTDFDTYTMLLETNNYFLEI